MAALAIDHKIFRAQVLIALLPSVTEPAIYSHAIHQAVMDHLRKNLADQKRAAVLQFCRDSSLFAPPILSPPRSSPSPRTSSRSVMSGNGFNS
jgi:hypothetical protein